MEASTCMVQFQAARTALANARTVDEIKEVRDKAAAIRLYLKQAGESLEMQNDAAEIKLRAERRMGEILAKMELRGGDRKSKSRDVILKLDNLGIAPMQSHRYQKIASLPKRDFESYLSEYREAKKEITTSAALKLAKQHTAQHPAPTIIEIPSEDSAITSDLSELAGEKFGTIYADPPWKYGNQGTRAATDNHYGTMSVDELCEMPVPELAADDAHLHLWTTNAFLPESFRLIEAWGFEYRSCFVWVKPQMGIGNYWRVSHEFLLLGIRGNAKSFKNHSQMSWGQFDRTKHSAKPEQIRTAIELCSPGPYLELFGRNQIQGWTVYGNQISKQGSLLASGA